MSMSLNELNAKFQSGEITPETCVGPGSTTAAELYAWRLHHGLGMEPAEAFEKVRFTPSTCVAIQRAYGWIDAEYPEHDTILSRFDDIAQAAWIRWAQGGEALEGGESGPGRL